MDSTTWPYPEGVASLNRLRLRARAFTRMPTRSKLVFVPALVLNPLFRLVVKRKGIKSATALALRFAGQPVVGSTKPAEALPIARQVVLGVRAAAGALPLEVVCLPRSLTAWTILNRLGVDSSLRVGMDPSAGLRTAHAWVEVDGEAVGEIPTHIAQMADFAEPILGTRAP